MEDKSVPTAEFFSGLTEGPLAVLASIRRSWCNTTRQSSLVSVALLLFCSLSLPAQKKASPKAIRFQGAPQYTQQELLAAAGLKPDAPLNIREVKAHAKQLSDTGLFEVVKFSADARIQERFPLYRGLLPASGSMLEGICRAFEEMLAAKGIKATVKAALTSGLGPQKLTAINFTVVSPEMHIGRIQLAGISSAMQAKASLLASGETGNGFDTENTAIGLQHAFEELYQDQGYAAVQVDVFQDQPLIVSDQSVEIPYTVTIKEGGIYKVGTIDFPANALVARAEVEKIRSKYPSGSGRPLDLFLLAVRDAYHAHGYLDCTVVAHPSFNEGAHIVNYSLEITPGLQYRLGSVKFDGAPDAMAAKLKLAWKMAPGAIFDESYPSNFASLAQKKDKLLTRWMQTVITTYDVKADPATHEVNCIFHFAKAAQSPP